MKIKQISVFVENTVGRVAAITRSIADAGVDIRALSMADTSDFGILRLIVNKPEAAIEKLQKAGLTVILTDVIAVGIEDKPGAFADVADILGKANVNIEYMYAFVSRKSNNAFVILRVEDWQRGMDALETAGVYLLDGSEVYDM